MNLDWLLENLAQRGDADAVIDGSEVYITGRCSPRSRDGPRLADRRRGPGRDIRPSTGSRRWPRIVGAAIGGNILVPISMAVDAHATIPRRSPKSSTASRDRTAERRRRRRDAGRRIRSTRRCARPPTPGLVLFSSGIDRHAQGGGARPRACCSQKFEVAAAALPHAGLPAARSHRRAEHAVLHAGERRHGGRRPRAAIAARGLRRRSRAIGCSCCRRRRRSCNMLLLSEEHQRHDLSSLELITYGTEPMPAHHAGARARGLPGRAAAADLRPERARHPALAVARVRIRCGSGSAARASRPRSSTAACVMRRSRRCSATSTRRARSTRTATSTPGTWSRRRRLAAHSRPRHRSDQRRRQQGVAGRGRERAARDGERRRRRGARRAQPDHRARSSSRRSGSHMPRIPRSSRRGCGSSAGDRLAAYKMPTRVRFSDRPALGAVQEGPQCGLRRRARGRREADGDAPAPSSAHRRCCLAIRRRRGALSRARRSAAATRSSRRWRKDARWCRAWPVCSCGAPSTG